MTKSLQPHVYAPIEEKLNVISHAAGLVLSIAALAFLVAKAMVHGTVIHTISFAIFGTSLVILYAASTLYHSARSERARVVLRKVDHASIYLLIAGTYTPFALITLRGTVGWVVFGTVWGMTLIGATLKLFFAGHFDGLSTVIYVIMGWIILFAIKPLVANLSSDGLSWLLAGGISYTVGALFYSLKKIPLGHATFHVFVLAGSVCHFVAVYFFVLTK